MGDSMEVYAITKFVRMAPSKARELAQAVQGLPVQDALNKALFTKSKAGEMIGKTIKSAIANAENNAELSAETLFVKQALVDRGPQQRRFWARARGMASPIKRKTSHIKIVLSDEKASASAKS